VEGGVVTGVSPDAYLGAITALTLALSAGMIRLIITTTRTEAMLRAHIENRQAHRG
jgi:hypothetical protein